MKDEILAHLHDILQAGRAIKEFIPDFAVGKNLQDARRRRCPPEADPPLAESCMPIHRLGGASCQFTQLRRAACNAADCRLSPTPEGLKNGLLVCGQQHHFS